MKRLILNLVLFALGYLIARELIAVFGTHWWSIALAILAACLVGGAVVYAADL
jgi:hypothetical protein